MLLKKTIGPQEKLLYVIERMKIDGRLKLMKLMFFLEHLDLKTNKLTPDKIFSGNEFIIYRFGPFSFDVVNSMQKLKENDLVVESSPDGSHIVPSLSDKGKDEIQKVKEEMSKECINRVNEIKEKFDSFSGRELENKSLEYLHIKKEDKGRYLGVPVAVIITENS